MWRTRSTIIFTISAGNAQVTAFSQLKVKTEKNDMVQQGIEHMISRKDGKRRKREVMFTFGRKRKYVNIGYLLYM